MPESLTTFTNFGPLDWCIAVAFLVGSTVAGLWSRRYIHNLEGFLIAGRRVRGHLGVASIIATEMGLVTVVYSAQKGFTGGFATFHIALAAAAVALAVGLTGFIVVPLRRAGVMTIPEFYERRFGRAQEIRGCPHFRIVARNANTDGRNGGYACTGSQLLLQAARILERAFLRGAHQQTNEPVLGPMCTEIRAARVLPENAANGAQQRLARCLTARCRIRREAIDVEQ